MYANTKKVKPDRTIFKSTICENIVLHHFGIPAITILNFRKAKDCLFLFLLLDRGHKNLK